MRQRFFNKLLHKLLSSKRADKAEIFEQLLQAKECEESVFYSLNTRPVKTGGISQSTPVIEKQAIVMQGPLVLKDNFTVETIKLYVKIIAPALLILSTWEDEDINIINEIKSLGVTVIPNKLPEYPGNQNINLQIISAHAGITKAKSLGAAYVLKTRTDQRIYSTSALQLFHNLLAAFPVTAPAQKQRLIATSLATIKYRLYGVSDMLMYGNIDDMLNYWSPELDTRKFGLKEVDEYSVKEFSQLRLGEMYLCSKYFEKIGHTLNWSLKQSWDLIGRYFCIIDHSSIDLYWPKYDSRTEFRYKFYQTHTLQNMSFANWLNFYLNKETNYPENYLDMPFGKEII